MSSSANVLCFKHKGYKGTTAPNLSCKVCCTIYIANIKRMQEQMRAENLTPISNEKTSAKIGNGQPIYDAGLI